MSDILFIRHAETDMAGTFCGHSDPDLNTRGHEQTAELIDRLRSENIAVVYTSDLCRAQTTAEAIASAFGIECRARRALREISFGEWEGLTWKEIEQRDEDYARQWITKHPLLPTPEGEAFRDFEQRVLEEVAFLSTKVAERDIAVVTHAGVLRTVLCSLHRCSEEDAWRQTKPYCAILRHAVAASPQAQFVEARS
jgi:alpha-ribazole phosphatase/probable phosphoglycerate mutase